MNQKVSKPIQDIPLQIKEILEILMAIPFEDHYMDIVSATAFYTKDIDIDYYKLGFYYETLIGNTEALFQTPKPIASYMSLNSLNKLVDRDPTLQGMRNLKILDPSVGCGNFLESTLNALADIAIERNIHQGYSKQTLMELFLPCVYGWDINPQALVICAYRLYRITQCYDFDFFKIPNLHCGNSLIPETLPEWARKYIQSKSLPKAQQKSLF